MNTQEQLWSGPFGDEYTERNDNRVAENLAFFVRALARAEPPRSILELGAGSGDNLRALRLLYPKAQLSAVEINEEACARLPADVRTWNESALAWQASERFDLVLTKGFLIHIGPEDLGAVYDTLLEASARYILIAEYFNPTPVEVEYREQGFALWKRDFAGELLDRGGIRLVDYGFVSRLDQWPQDDVNWWLCEKA